MFILVYPWRWNRLFFLLLTFVCQKVVSWIFTIYDLTRRTPRKFPQESTHLSAVGVALPLLDMLYGAYSVN